MKLGDFIRQYRIEHGISQRSFAKMSSLSNAYISMLENGINPSTGRPVSISISLLQKLAVAMNTTIDYIVDNIEDTPVELLEEIEILSNLKNEKLSPLTPSPNLMPIEPMERIPLLGAIACGYPILAQENIEDYIDLPRTIKADFALTCEGDSMIDAGIKDGDVVYIRSQPEVQNGQIAAVLVDGESATLKRFFFNDGVVTLMAANQSYPPIVKAGSDVEQVRVLGLAVGLSRSFFK